MKNRNASAKRPESLDRGRILELEEAPDARLRSYVYAPLSVRENPPIFISVHGISENAQEHAKSFLPSAEEYGVVLVAPCFTPENFLDYQRLGRFNRGQRADLALLQLISRVAVRFGARADKIFLFGFSGGGQFVHRFAMAHPKNVAAYVTGAAGWYTFPDPAITYPRGIGKTHDLEVEFDPMAFLQVPGAVIVGERDIHQGYSLNKSPKIVAQQGRHRLERACRWVAAMNAAAEQYGSGVHYSIFTMPRCNHCFSKSMKRGRMAQRVFQWLFKR